MPGFWVLGIYCPLHLSVLNFVDFPNTSEKLTLNLDHKRSILGTAMALRPFLFLPMHSSVGFEA